MGLVQASGKVTLSNVSGAQSLTAGSAFGAGNSVVLCLAAFNPSTPGASAVTIGGVSATKVSSHTAGTNAVEIWLAQSVTAVNTLSVTVSAGSYLSLSYEEWSGFSASATDSVNNASGVSNSPSATTATLAQADEVTYFAFFPDGGILDTTTPPGGFSVGFTEPDGANQEPGGSVYKVVAATTAVTATWTLGSSQGWSVAFATFKITAAAPTPLGFLRTNRRTPGFPPRAPLPGVAMLGRGLLAPPAIARALTLVADQGSYALTGNDAGLNRPPACAMPLPQPRTRGVPARVLAPGFFQLGAGILVAGTSLRALTLSCAQGSYALTGQALTLTRAVRLTAVQGSYLLSGQALTLGEAMPAAQGSYALTGQALTLTRALRMTAAQGSYALTGQSVTLTRAVRLTCVQGSYALTGQTLGLGSTVPCAQGSYALTGQATTLTRALRLVCAQGSYSLSGQAVTLTFNSSGSHTLTATQGSYAVSGQSVGLLRSLRLTCAQGSYSLTGQAVTLTTGKTLTAAQGSYALSGQAMVPKRALRLAMAQGGYALSGQSTTLTFNPAGSHTLTAQTGSYAVSGQSVGLLVARRLVASLGTYALTGEPANTNYGRPPLAAVGGSYALTGGDVSFTVTRRLTAVAGSYVVTGRTVTLRFVPATIPIAPPEHYFYAGGQRRNFVVPKR